MPGLDRRGAFQQFVQFGRAILSSEVVVDIRKRLRGVWRQATQPSNEVHFCKAFKYHNWVVLPHGKKKLRRQLNCSLHQLREREHLGPKHCEPFPPA